MSLERPHSRVGWRERGPPPAPPPTYLWEELRRSRSRGGYPWTILDKEPLPDQLDIELLLKGRVQFITVDEDDERLEIESTYERGRHSSRGRKRFRDHRNRITRSRSEPTTVGADDMERRVPAAASSIHSGESEDFSLNDEDIPDFVMAYLQSDKGNLDEDIPDHILEYIQSRAAQLEKNQKYAKQPAPLPADDLFYTEDEMRIINEARRRLEEQGEFGPTDPALQSANDDMNNFDDFFARAAVDQQVVQPAPPEEQVEYEGAVAQVPPEEPEQQKKGGKFNLKNLSIPSKSQLKLKLPKLRTGEKKKSENVEEDEPVEGKKRKQKTRRPESSSPIRQKISQQFENWNANLKRVLPRRNQQDGQVKGFVALLPGRSRSRPAKLTHPENQYEEIGKPREETEFEEKANGSYNFEGEETMEDVENLPESEEVDVAHVNPEIIDREVIDALYHREFVDVDFKEKEENQKQEPNVATEKFGALAARGRQALEATKTRIQQSKEKLQATGTRLQSTLAKQNFAGNLEATRKKVQSTLSPKNLAATGNKLQSTLTNTLKKRKGKKSSDIISSEPAEEQDAPAAALQDSSAAPVHESYYDPVEAPTATARRRAKKKESVQLDGDPLFYAERGLERDQECEHVEHKNVEREEELEDEEEEIEPRMEFSLYQPDRPAPESVDQSTETLPEDVEGEKENAVVRPSRRRFSSKNRTDGARPRPHSMHCESSGSVSSAWPGARPKYPVHYPAVSQEILATFAAPINALDAVDPWRSVPAKPPRSRSKKDLHTMSDTHLYANVAPPRRSKKQSSWSTGTWPRKSPSVEYPTAPRRLKPKQNKEQVNPSEMQTWPRRRRTAKSPPAAPKRTRSKRKLDGEDTEEELKKRVPDGSNILTDPDTLFGVESRYIDEEEMNKKSPPLPDLNQLAEADVLFGAESRFIDDDSSIRSVPVTSQVVETLNIPVAEPELEPMLIVEPEMMEEIHQQIIPILRSRKKNSRKSTENVSDNSLPRAPSAPIRRKHSIKSQSNEDTYATLSKARKEPPPVPVPISTPSEEETVSLPPADETDIASAQAGIDKILEILATFPKEPEAEVKQEVIEPPQVTQAEDHLQEKVENPYSEINHGKRKAPPPRPPAPPAYGPETTDSYSYIYTVPRRKKLEKAKPGASPERPPRTYCTIRPHRPPRRTRAVTEAVSASTVALAEQRAPSLSTETRTRSFSVGDKEERDLQSAPVIERMRARPLPPPPRLKRLQSRSPPPKPPRSQSSTLRRKRDSESQDTQPKPQAQEIAIPVESSVHEVPVPTVPPSSVEVQERLQQSAVPLVVVTSDGYEPIEEPATVAEPDPVEEISVGIQTDPLPEYEDSSTVEAPKEETVHCDQIEETVQETSDRPRRLPQGLNNLSFDKLDDDTKEEVKPYEPLTYTNIQAHVTCEETECVVEEEAPKISNIDEPAKEAVKEETAPATVPSVETPECPKQAEEKDCQGSKPEEEDVKRPPRRTRHQHDDEDECDSYSRIPESFARLAAPIPPLRVELPTRLQLSELEVERLNVREVTADRLVVSSVDTNSLQVCQMATSNASGQLVFNLGPGATLPPLLLAPASSNESTEEPERPKRSNKSDREKTQNIKKEEAAVKAEEAEAVVTPQVELAPLQASTAPVQRAEVAPPAQVTPTPVLPAPSAPTAIAPAQAQIVEPVAAVQAAVVAAPTQNAAVVQPSSPASSTAVNQTETEEANIGDLALQLAGASARRLGSAAITATSEAYSIAQKVAELGWQQLNEHLQRQGIYFDDKERENVKAVLLMLLLVISAIFLLGPGRIRSINHWDFYFPN